jgi:hypothetical protein
MTSEVYVPLQGEGTDVCWPTRALPRGEMRFQLLATEDYDPEDELWGFPPGSVVGCRLEQIGGREMLVARTRIG